MERTTGRHARAMQEDSPMADAKRTPASLAPSRTVAGLPALEELARDERVPVDTVIEACAHAHDRQGVADAGKLLGQRLGGASLTHGQRNQFLDRWVHQVLTRPEPFPPVVLLDLLAGVVAATDSLPGGTPQLQCALFDRLLQPGAGAPTSTGRIADAVQLALWALRIQQVPETALVALLDRLLPPPGRAASELPSNDIRGSCDDQAHAQLMEAVATALGGSRMRNEPARILAAHLALHAQGGRIARLGALTGSVLLSLGESHPQRAAVLQPFEQCVSRLAKALTAGARTPRIIPDGMALAAVALVEALEERARGLRLLERGAPAAAPLEQAIETLQQALTRPARARADAKGHPAQDTTLRTECADVIGRFAATADVEADAARHAGWAFGLGLGGLSMPEAVRDHFLACWCAHYQQASAAIGTTGLCHLLRGFIRACEREPAHATANARWLLDRLCTIGARLENKPGPWNPPYMIARMVRDGMFALGGSEISDALLRDLLDHLLAANPAAGHAAHQVPRENLGMLVAAIGAGVGSMDMAVSRRQVFMRCVLGLPAGRHSPQAMSSGLIGAMGARFLPAQALREVLDAITGEPAPAAALRGSLIEALLATLSGDDEARLTDLLTAARHLVPGRLGRFACDLAGHAWAGGIDDQSLARAVLAAGSTLGSAQRAVIACGHAVAREAARMDDEEFHRALVSAYLPQDASSPVIDTRADVMRGLRLARDPVALITDPALEAQQRVRLLEVACQLPGLLNAQTAAALFSCTMTLPVDADLRHEMLGALFLHGARHLKPGMFAVARTLMTTDFVSRLEGYEKASGLAHESALAATGWERETRLPPAQLQACVDGVSRISALYETLPEAVGLEGLYDGKALPGARQQDIAHLRKFLAKEQQRVGKLGEPSGLRDHLATMLGSQARALEPADIPQDR